MEGRAYRANIFRLFSTYFSKNAVSDVAPKAIWIGRKSLGEAVIRAPSVLIINAKTIENHSNELQ